MNIQQRFMPHYQRAMRLMALLFVCFSAATSWAQKYVGGDISLLTQYEDHGANYYDVSGNAISSPLEFFKEQGLNAMRVRLFVDPNNATDTEKGEGVCQDLDYVIALGKRIKDAGFKLMLDFHYSDTWADPAKQWTPKDWLSLSDDQLCDKIYEYTVSVLQKMKASDAQPDLIQTGNEISYGMLWGDVGTTANRCYSGSSDNWGRFTNLLKSAAKACRAECPEAKIILHTERVPKPSVLTNFYNQMANAEVDYDVIGLSYYPYYHGTLTSLNAVLNSLERTFSDKEIMIVEAGYYHDWQPSGFDYDLSSTYPITAAGQKSFTEDLIKTLNQHEKVTGLFWWWMEANEMGLDWNTQRVTTNWYNAGLFDNQTGRAMPALSVLKNFLANDTRVASPTAEATSGATEWFSLDGKRAPQSPQKGLFIAKNKKILLSKQIILTEKSLCPTGPN